MAKSRFGNFLKGYDRYAKPVLLSYKRNGNFTTSVGGFCSIFSFIVLAYWLIINIQDTFAAPGKFSDKSQKLAFETKDGVYDPIEVPISRVFSAYQLYTYNEDITSENIDDYVQGLWFQVNEDETVNVYKAIKCTEVPELQEIIETDDQFKVQVKDYMCPDLQGKSMTLQ